MLGSLEIEEMKTEYELLLKATKRENIENLIRYLKEETDFFVAPASTNYHGSYKYGLLEHSLIVTKNLIALSKVFKIEESLESLYLIGLLHDVCKTNFYSLEKRNRKKKDSEGNNILINNKAQWEEIETYVVNDSLPLGHGEKSVIIIQNHIKLTLSELMAIRWHMMSYDDITKGYAGNLSLTNALNKFPIIALTHMADLSSISLELNKEEKHD